MKRFSGLAVPLATFLFTAVLAFAVNPAMGLLGLLTAGGMTGGEKPCEIKIFRDEPYFTKVLDDWPQQGTCPRSPKYVFGKDRPITVEVRLPGTAYEKVIVQVVNKDLAAPGPKTIDIECDHVGNGIYRSRITGKDEILYLADHTEERSNGDLIHVREEEVLEFVLKEPSIADCKYDVMVDRGEGAATTVVENHKPGMKAGFEGAATRFMNGVGGFDTDTTGWWDVGQALSSANFVTFLLNAGADDTDDVTKKNWESDILFIGAHSYPDGNYCSAESATNYPQIFGPDKTRFQKKPGAPEKTDTTETPQHYYINSNGNVTTFGPKTWNTDIDWALSYSCNTLAKIMYDVGKLTTPDKKPPFFTQDPGPNNTRTAIDRWKKAFTGSPRKLHGILGYWTTGSNAGKILEVIPEWTKNVKAGEQITEAWANAVGDKDRDKGAAILYIPRNWVDTIDSMQRDPCDGETPEYWASTMKRPAKKGEGKPKPLIDGKVPATGVKMPQPSPDVEPGESGRPIEPEPSGKLLQGRCLLFTDFPRVHGRFPRLNLTRSEVLAPDSLFALDAEGTYLYKSATVFGQVAANTLSPAAAETNLRAFLAAQFSNFSGLDTYGVYEGTGLVLDGVSTPVACRFETLLEQRYQTLPVFDSGVYARQDPFGVVERARVIYYDIAPSGTPLDLLSARQATEVAALDFLSRFPGRPCEVTLIVPFYGEPAEIAPGVKEVRPVWAIEFSGGEFVTTLDAVTGAILRLEGE
jgi:hypothetical protein